MDCFSASSMPAISHLDGRWYHYFTLLSPPPAPSFQYLLLHSLGTQATHS
ncbi:hypothetical protein E2C01_074729 [Portunus trituberculatus]|uniref:Uncharacterized protein n=1 Tax=Portunus trituberculatus TaxID=210409 RepID=A0A5B7I6E1_PORTR|nr:hypothetical protein [Portunus trituberculatus]